ncbi:unnamed protein product [Diatraea saccharalis]|uniref:Putative zinc-finger domain-containing protein n=1 Tax=Diatraea saccharalis TaxID=40085 RepID=A0A9N9WGF8_9NEOP|nr:unnamed protein product [Diatraea saccharalis]
MACIENIPPANADSEMEEGEIVDDLDDLSDISSEEEFLLRQRLQVLENYNNVLERKKAKTSFSEPGACRITDTVSHDLSDISDKEDEYPRFLVENKNYKQEHVSIHRKHKKRKESTISNVGKNKEHKKKSHRTKKRSVAKNISESSEESEDEYRNKRRKLANAVSVTKDKNDISSLKDRLEKMLCGNQNYEPIKEGIEENIIFDITKSLDWSLNASGNSNNNDLSNKNIDEKHISIDVLDSKVNDIIDLCKDDTTFSSNITGNDCVDSVFVEKNNIETKKDATTDSDEDLELLRQHALKTKVTKLKTEQPNLDVEVSQKKPQNISEDEDSDTAELRIICLKSALLKKAIEAKQKQRLRKRLSQSFPDEFQIQDSNICNEVEADNNTDIESVDMDIGSDGDDKLKDLSNNYGIIEETKREVVSEKENNALSDIPMAKKSKEDEMDEDEDLLRAKLLTSLSKNLPNLIHPNIINNIDDVKSKTELLNSKTSTAPEEKPFIIKLGESDSEGEHEATKNLTKMHMKLSEQVDFQQKLDLFLKSTRMEVEKKTLPDVIQRPLEQPKSTPKFVAKAVKHLPKSEQIEYKNLVKRMAELEKIKQARQTSMNLNKMPVQAKDTLKPRNVTIDTIKNNAIENLEEQIASSRKVIAEESSKMLKLKEEATKLTQKYKIVETELRNISTAITFNKKQQKAIQNKLSTIRLQHQMLLKRSSSLKHSKINMPNVNKNNIKSMSNVKLQKENNPRKEEYKNPQLLKAVKVSVHNDLKEDNTTNAMLSVQIDVSNNKKVVKMPKCTMKERTVDINNAEKPSELNGLEKNDTLHPEVEKGGGMDITVQDTTIEKSIIDDYKSPLESLHGGTWAEDPNSFLCPFEVGGICKDPDCKYLHPKIPSAQ